MPKDLRSKGQGSKDSDLVKRGAEKNKKPKGKILQNGRGQVRNLKGNKRDPKGEVKLDPRGSFG